MAGLSLSHFSASWHVFINTQLAQRHSATTIPELQNHLDGEQEVEHSKRRLQKTQRIFSLDMGKNQFYSLFTKIQTFE
jgi:hypothetical protein